jgi:phage-related protein
MRTVGPGVRQIRIHIAGAHPLFYLTTRPEGIYALHAFEKKTQNTSAADLRSRLRGLEQLR